LAEPLITIGITCYSEGEWLRECWESVLAQDDDRWETVIVMDGGANEETRRVFASLSHPRLRKIALEKNVGCHCAHNVAFEHTRTPYHFYVDADDRLLPSSVALVLDAFAQHPESYCVHGDYILFGGDSGRTSVTMGSCAYRTDVWAKVGGFAPELTVNKGDLDFHIAALEAGFPKYHFDGPFYAIRIHPDRISKAHAGTSWREHEDIVRRHPGYFGDRERRRHFLSEGYERGFAHYCSVGDFRSAARLYRRARSRGIILCEPVRAVEIMSPGLCRPVVRQVRFRWNGLVRRLSPTNPVTNASGDARCLG